jgi:ArsR family metal-binding transcriptional regulator
MRYKKLITKKLGELINMIMYQSSQISQLRPPQELKETLEKMQDKINEVQHLIDTEHDS